MSNLESVLRLFGAAFIIFAPSFVVYRITTIKLQKKKDARETREREDRERKLRDQQDNIGNRFFNAMMKAASFHPGGCIRVEKIPNNGNSYTVIVTKHDSYFTVSGTSYRSDIILTIDVNIIHDRWDIRTFAGAHGPYTYYKLCDGVEVIIAELSRMIMAYDTQTP